MTSSRKKREAIRAKKQKRKKQRDEICTKILAAPYTEGQRQKLLDAISRGKLAPPYWP